MEYQQDNQKNEVRNDEHEIQKRTTQKQDNRYRNTPKIQNKSMTSREDEARKQKIRKSQESESKTPG